MAQLKGKHVIAEIGGIRCTVVESGIREQRADFLTDLLTFNGYDVRVEEEKAKDGTPAGTLILGVTDILFNPPIALFQRKLFRRDGKTVSQVYWNQWPGNPDIPYWLVVK
jgi:hypothetical protein